MTAFNLKSLLDRRVPQILGAYLGCSWGVIEFTTLIVDRYLLSPHLVDLTIVLLALFVPSACMLAWNHGPPGDDEWTRTETVGLSLNGVCSLVVIFLLFGAKDLGTVTKTVSVTDEEGTAMEKEVPKSEFRKEVALFYFDNESGDPGLDWARYGLPMALRTDLDQDLFVRVNAGFTEELRQRGFEDATGAPVALKQEVAREARRAHFLSGSFQPSDSGVTVRTELRETETGDLVNARTVTGSGVLDVVDRISVLLRKDLGVPSAHLEEVKDLPAAELTTSSSEAFRAYAKGIAARSVQDDLDAAQEALEIAVGLDSTFALAQAGLYSVYFQQNQSAKAETAISAAMDHLYKLPLRYQFSVKDNFYFWKQKPDKRLTVAEMRVEFYPEDVEAHLDLAELYQQRNQSEEALRQYRRVLEIDPSRHQTYNSLGSIQKEMGRYEEARSSYQKYAEHFPKDPDPFHELGRLFQRTGELDSAATYFEKAHLLKPENVDYLVRLGDLRAYRGEFEAALASYEKAQNAAKTPSQRAQVLGERMDYYKGRGQIKRALEVREQLVSTAARAGGASAEILVRTITAPLYAEIGRGDKALRLLDKLQQKTQWPLDQLVPLGRTLVFLEREDAEALEKLLPKVQAVAENFGITTSQRISELMQGEIHRLRGECSEALPFYEKALSFNPDSASEEANLRSRKARCHRSLGQLAEARAEVRKALRKIPIHPEALREKALIHRDREEQTKAVKALEKALRVYEPADSAHVKARQIRSLHDELLTESGLS